MGRLQRLLNNRAGTAAAELALVIPILLTLMFGSLELGNLFLDEHALSKQVRDGARFGSRLQLSDSFACPADVFLEDDATEQIIKVTKDGVVTGTGNPRWTGYWDRTCTTDPATLTVSIKCVQKSAVDTEDSGSTGMYTSLDGDEIPVVQVSGAVRYRSILAAIGFDSTNVCLRAESEAPVMGV
jgi:TadE-like protein